jgi:Xaa-Pro aminopeptidase
VDRELLSGEDLAWWNAYHARVLEVVGPLVDGAAKAWLAEQCRPLDA